VDLTKGTDGGGVAVMQHVCCGPWATWEVEPAQL
jgi:hypothetical protein